MNYKKIIIITAVLVLLVVLVSRGDDDSMRKPIKKWVVTSPFGNRTNPITFQPQFHNGIDLSTPTGSDIFSPAKGYVTEVYSNSTGGLQLVIEHDNGYRTGYAHLSSVVVSPGDRVKKGELVAYTGNTGSSTGPHLHFTLKKNGEYIDPETVF